MKIRRLLILASFLVFPVACGKKAPPPAAPPQVHAVVATAAARGPLEAVVLAVAEARPVREGLLAADAVGRVEEIREEGDILRKGELVARLDPDRSDANLEVLEARIATAQNDRAQRERDLARAERLEHEGVASRQEVENARWAVEDAGTRIAAARAAAREGYVTLMRRLVRAPYNGVILERKARAGEVVAPGQTLVRFGDLSTLEISAAVGEADAIRIRSGAWAVVAFDAKPGETFTARVHRVDRALTPGARTAECVVRLPNRAGLPAGLLARALIKTERKDDVLSIPAASVRSGPEGSWVWVIADGKSARRSVRVGIAGEVRVEILAGLDAGDSVVVRGGENLVEGDLLAVETAR